MARAHPNMERAPALLWQVEPSGVRSSLSSLDSAAVNAQPSSARSTDSGLSPDVAPRDGETAGGAAAAHKRYTAASTRNPWLFARALFSPSAVVRTAALLHLLLVLPPRLEPRPSARGILRTAAATRNRGRFALAAD
eukprot:6272070-Prymnesium_polylepis.1